jgi:Putative MetA-pathway of phenol degradation
MMMKVDVLPGPRVLLVHTALGLTLLFGVAAAAQELEPRAYSPSPVGTSFVAVGFSRSSGDISFDPTIPITNAQATLYAPAIGVGQTFGLFGRQALVVAGLPYAWGNASGDVGNGEQSLYRSGLADVKARFSLNLLGSPAMSPREFAKRSHHNLIVATSLTMTAPAGQYGNTKLINIGTNRWSFKPELGVSYPLRKLYLDLYAGVWFFTENRNFYTGQSVRSQSPLAAIQAHVSYSVKPRLWLAFDATWYGGGAATVNGGAPSEREGNSRLGGTVSLPLKKGQSFKVSYSSGVSGRIGSQFNTVTLGWQHVWFDRR